ncbi:MAG: MFS transporter [Pirellulaceae bacterium]|nr:MFS transporter [Pirellulaceae bacterium]
MADDASIRNKAKDNPYQSPSSNPEPESNAKTGSLLVIFLVVMIDLLGFGMVLPLLPIYAKQFTLDESGWQLGLLMASFSAMQFLFAPIWGMLSDRIGRRPVLMFGLFGSVVFYTLFGLATIWQSLPWIFACRIGAGICGATISTAQAYIADTTSDAGRSRGMALVGMAFGVGFTFGPLLGYFAVPDGQSAPGPWLGWLAAILSAVALIMAAFLLPESLRPSSRSAADRFKLSNFGVAWKLAGVPAILGLIFMVVFSFAGFETTLTLVLKGELFDFEWRDLCLTMALIGFSSAIIQGAVVRPLYKRVSDKQMALIGSGLEVIGFLAMTWAVSAQSLPGFFAALMIVVAGFAFIQPSVHSLLSRMAPDDRQGAVLGTGQSVNALARIMGSALAIPLLKWNLLAPYVLAAGLLALAGVFLQRSLRSRG